MEWFTAISASLLTLFSSAGIIIDTVIAQQLRAQVKEVEQLNVRLDNTPNYQILQGKVDKIRVASHGVHPLADLRIDTIALETDRLDVDLSRLQGKGNQRFSQALRRSAQGAIQIVLTEGDLNLALKSPEIRTRLEKYINRLLPNNERSFVLTQANLDFLPHNRIKVQVQLQQITQGLPPETLEMVVESGIKTNNGKNLQIIEPVASLNGRQISKRLLNGFAEGLSEPLDLGTLEKDGILARILQLKIEDQKMTIAAFVRVTPSSREQQREVVKSDSNR